jgi:PPOX class probable F420-dependent enzyme
MDFSDALAFARNHRQGVLTTLRSNGRPQLSNILYTTGDDGVVRISITGDRAKYHNLVREPWAALHISREDFWAYVVLESDVSLSPIAAAPDDETVEELVAVYRALMGEHEDWDKYRRAMVSDRRVVVRLTPVHTYGMLPRNDS